MLITLDKREGFLGFPIIQRNFAILCRSTEYSEFRSAEAKIKSSRVLLNFWVQRWKHLICIYTSSVVMPCMHRSIMGSHIGSPWEWVSCRKYRSWIRSLVLSGDCQLVEMRFQFLLETDILSKLRSYWCGLMSCIRSDGFTTGTLFDCPLSLPSFSSPAWNPWNLYVSTSAFLAEPDPPGGLWKTHLRPLPDACCATSIKLPLLAYCWEQCFIVSFLSPV